MTSTVSPRRIGAAIAGSAAAIIAAVALAMSLFALNEVTGPCNEASAAAECPSTMSILVSNAVEQQFGTTFGITFDGTPTADRTLTLPDADDTLVGRDTTDTLTNKSLTSPTLTGSPTAAGATWPDVGTITTADINGGTIDGATIGGSSPGAGTFTSLNATGGGSLTGTWSDLGTITTVDVNGGTIDGATIGGSSPGAGTFTSLNATGGGSLTGTWSDLGVVTTVDVNGGTIDGTNIGATTPGTGSFSSLAVGSGDADLQNNDLNNVGNSGTDFTSSEVTIAQNDITLGDLVRIGNNDGGALYWSDNVADVPSSGGTEVITIDASTEQVLVGRITVSGIHGSTASTVFYARYNFLCYVRVNSIQSGTVTTEQEVGTNATDMNVTIASAGSGFDVELSVVNNFASDDATKVTVTIELQSDKAINGISY